MFEGVNLCEGKHFTAYWLLRLDLTPMARNSSLLPQLRTTWMVWHLRKCCVIFVIACLTSTFQYISYKISLVCSMSILCPMWSLSPPTWIPCAIWTFQNAPQLVGNIWMDQGKHVVFGEVLEGLEASWSFSMKTWSIFWTNYPKTPQAKLPVSHLEGFWLLRFLAIFWSQNQEVNGYESQLENLTISVANREKFREIVINW